MDNKAKNAAVEYSKELKADLDDRRGAYLSGREELISAAESKQRINKLFDQNAKLPRVKVDRD